MGQATVTVVAHGTGTGVSGIVHENEQHNDISVQNDTVQGDVHENEEQNDDAEDGARAASKMIFHSTNIIDTPNGALDKAQAKLEADTQAETHLQS